MHLLIEHNLRYRYDQPVFIEPTAVRLRPQDDCRQRLIEHDLRIDPQPAGIAAIADIDGNETTNVWFDGLHDALHVTVRSVVETLIDDPFQYILPDDAQALPVMYSPPLDAAMKPYLARAEADRAVDQLASEMVQASGGDVLRFLMDLTVRLNNDLTIEPRQTGEPYAPSHTLATGGGACRDVAVLFMDICRAAGLAARFVSGYKAFDLKADVDHDLHAWASVYLPGAGWRGYDPSEGVAVADRHVIIAAAADSALAAPITGAFRRSGATSTLEHTVSITEA